MRRSVPFLALVSLVVAALPAGAQTRYIAFGDSITEGFGFDEPSRQCPEECGYAPRLEALLDGAGMPSEVVNAGRGGETTIEGLSRIDDVLAREGGDVLLLMEGTNDIIERVSPETIRFNLNAIAERAAARGLSTVHATLIPRAPTANEDPDNEENQLTAWQIRDLAHTRGRGLADPFEVFRSRPNVFQELYTGGGVGHPNPAGFDVLARIFFDVIRGVDAVPPVPGDLFPRDGRTGVRPRDEVHLLLFDFGAGIDVGGTDLLIDGVAVPASIEGGGSRVDLRYTPPEGFSGFVDVGYRARDLAGNQRERTLGTFSVEGTQRVRGDLDRDGRVDGVDLVLLALRFGSRQGESRFLAAADLDADGDVDGTDLAILADNFGRATG